jgi:hypothetical protein
VVFYGSLCESDASSKELVQWRRGDMKNELKWTGSEKTTRMAACVIRVLSQTNDNNCGCVTGKALREAVDTSLIVVTRKVEVVYDENNWITQGGGIALSAKAGPEVADERRQ